MNDEFMRYECEIQVINQLEGLFVIGDIQIIKSVFEVYFEKYRIESI